MRINKNENISPYDVDGTLIIHEDPNTIPAEDQIRVFDTITEKFIVVRINRPMVRLLKESKARGEYVRVWSRGGWQWAYSVVEALGLIQHVDDVESKPTAYFDDTDINEWLKYRVFIKHDTVYKQLTKGETN